MLEKTIATNAWNQATISALVSEGLFKSALLVVPTGEMKTDLYLATKETTQYAIHDQSTFLNMSRSTTAV
jgi:hypothetical protein